VTVARIPPDYGGPLTRADHEHLTKSWITPEIADAAMLRRVTHLEGEELIGQSRLPDCSGLAFPNYAIGNDRHHSTRLRLDNPKMRQAADGRVKTDLRYLSAPGAPNRLYFPPGVSAEQIGDIRIPLAFGEGEKKTLSLARLASRSSISSWFIPVGLAGIWGFRGTRGKALRPDGTRESYTGLIADIENLSLFGRTVYILYDADVRSNPKVRFARTAFAQELTARGAKVFYVDIPEMEGVKGVDDLLASVGPEPVLKLFKEAAPWDVEDKPSRGHAFLALAGELQLFHTSGHEPFARLNDKTHKSVPLSSAEFEAYLRHAYYVRFRKPISTQALVEGIGVLKGKAIYESPEATVFVRVGTQNGLIYVDLGDPAGRAIEIRVDGWSIVNGPPVHFRGVKGQLALPEPQHGGSVQLLKKYLNVTDNDFVLCLCWLVAACRPTGPYPILILQGEQGSAKSSTAGFLRRIIDPFRAPLRSMPKDERDLAISASRSWLLVFDNLSGVRGPMADALCRVATGGGFSTRALHTDADEVIFEFCRPMILNGIDRVSERQDLTDRAIVLTMPPIPPHERKDAATLNEEFERELPLILGALAHALSGALRRVTGVTLPCLPRLADFAKWAAAAEPDLGLESGSFLAAFLKNRALAIEESFDDDPIVELVRSIMEVQDVWEGSCTDLRSRLFKLLQSSGGGPTPVVPNGSGLSRRLRRLQAFLRESGIEVSFSRRSKGKREVRLQKYEPNAVTSVTRHDERASPETIEHFGAHVEGDTSSREVTVDRSVPICPSPVDKEEFALTHCTACGPIQARWSAGGVWECSICGLPIGDSRDPDPTYHQGAL
jgi:hypothetical protein